MRKPLSIILTVIMAFSVLSVIPVAADTPAEPVNLIVNGDAEGVLVDGVMKYEYTAEEGNAVPATRVDGVMSGDNIFKGAPYGWRPIDSEYNDATVQYPRTWETGANYHKNWSPTRALGINNWRNLAQDVELEAGKTYEVTAKMTTNIQTTDRSGSSLRMFLDAGEGLEAPTTPTGKAWYAEKVLSYTATSNVRDTTDTTVYYTPGDFTTHTFIFNADDFAAYNNLTAQSGKYHARIVFCNYSSAYAVFDDVSIYEVEVVKTSVKEQDGVFGGYVPEVSAIVGNETTVTAVPYKGNGFDGWYQGETKVSSDPAYTFTYTGEEDLVAKFTVNNRWIDSGYENIPVGTNMLLDKCLVAGTAVADYVWASEQPSIWWSATVQNTDVADGKQALSLTHRNNAVMQSVSVTPNTDYEFSFDWKLKNAYANSIDPSYLQSVTVYDSDGIKLAGATLNTLYSADFQTSTVYFNSGDNTQLFISIKYYAASGALYGDNFALLEKEVADGLVKVTYNMNEDGMNDYVEYVPSGSTYTVKEPNYRVSQKDFTGWTSGDSTYAKGDTVTLGTEDITFTANYTAYEGDVFSDTADFDPSQYDFTLVVMPDQQKLNILYSNRYSDISDWIVNSKDEYKIAGVIGLGDYTDGNTYQEWIRAADMFSAIDSAGIPFVAAPGNHDYNDGMGKGSYAGDAYERKTPYYNLMFDKNNYSTQTVTCEDVTGDSLMNSYYTLENGDSKYLVMSLEIFPRDSVLEWANEVVESHPDHKIIVATHSHLDTDGARTAANDSGSDYYSFNNPENSNSAQQVWDEFIKLHSNMFMFICGHKSSTDTVVMENKGVNGNTVYEILIDHQDDDISHKGVGNLTLIGINELANNASFTTISTLTGKYFNAENNDFTLSLGKGNQLAPAAPTLKDRGFDYIEVNGIENGEYSLDGINWQKEPRFEGLAMGLSYRIYQRYAATATASASPASEPELFTTLSLSDIKGPTLYEIDGVLYYVVNGEICEDETLVNFENTWYYVNNGTVCKDEALVEFYGTTYYAIGGKVDWSKNDLVKDADGNWYLVRNGEVSKETTLYQWNNGKWYYIKNGAVSRETTLVRYYTTWYYVNDGIVDFSATTLFRYYGTWYYVKGGVVDFSATTLCNYYGTWYYVKGGVADFSATTLVNYGGSWYYVKNGILNWGVETLVNYYGTWYYVKNSTVDFSATTLCNYYGTWYYVKGGVADFSATTLCNYYGTWYYVKGGVVDFSATTLVNYGGTWYYVKNGVLNWGVETLVNYYGTWYYVKNSSVNFSANLTYNFYGTNYKVVGGVVRF